MRDVFYLALASFSLGMVMSSNIFPKNLMLVLAVAYAVFVFYKILIRRRYMFALGFVFAVVGFASYGGIYNYKMSDLNKFLGTECDVSASVISKDMGTNSVKYTAKLTKINSENKNIKIMIYAPKDTDFNYGDKIVLKNVKPNLLPNGKNFDYNVYLKARGVFMTVYAPSDKIEKIADGKGILRSLCVFRNKSSEKVHKYLKDDCALVVEAIITGNKSNLQRKIKNAFAASGISHLLAVSGLHLTLLVMYAGGIFKKEDYITIRFVKPVFSIVLTLLAMVVTGLGYSVIRAGIMLILMNLAKILGREKNSINSLMIAAAVIIFANPYAVFDVGLELSFFATLGILIYSERINKFVKPYLHFGFISSTLSTTLAAQIFTMPLIVIYYNNIALYSVIANIIVIPLFTILLMISALFLICAFTIPFIPFVIKIFTGNIYLLVKIIVFIARFISRLPFSKIPVTSEEFLVSLFFAAAIWIICKNFKETKYRKLSVALSFVCVVGIFCANYDGRNLDVTFLDVGQGSCSHIKTPGGENIMIDCGVSKYYSKDDVGRYVAEPYLDSNGVTHLDYAILTHYHDDHFSGFLTLMQDGMVDVLILPKLKNSDDYEVYNTLKETAILNDVDINYFSRGSTLLLDDTKITVLSPSKNDYWEQNSESLVLKLTYKNSGFLFTGDIENDVMKTLKPEELVSDVIQSPHHGSNTSDLDSFYKNTQADYSVISAGKGNSYNHPHKEHIDALLSNGIKILRTDQNGTVYFKVDKKGNIKYKVEEGAK